MLRRSLPSILAALCVAGCSEDPYSGNQSTDSAAVRVTDQVSDLATIDFCVKGQATWLGPVMQVLLNQADGLPKGQTTGYLPLAGGTYTARLVDPKTAFCIPSMNGMDFSITVASGKKYTALASGYLMPAAGQPPVTLKLTQDP